MYNKVCSSMKENGECTNGKCAVRNVTRCCLGCFSAAFCYDHRNMCYMARETYLEKVIGQSEWEEN